MATYRRQVDPHVIGNLLRSHSSRIVVRMFRSVIPPDAPPWRPRLPQPIGVLGVREHGLSQAGEARHGGELLPEGLGRPGQKRRLPAAAFGSTWRACARSGTCRSGSGLRPCSTWLRNARVTPRHCAHGDVQGVVRLRRPGTPSPTRGPFQRDRCPKAGVDGPAARGGVPLGHRTVLLAARPGSTGSCSRVVYTPWGYTKLSASDQRPQAVPPSTWTG